MSLWLDSLLMLRSVDAELIGFGAIFDKAFVCQTELSGKE